MNRFARRLALTAFAALGTLAPLPAQEAARMEGVRADEAAIQVDQQLRQVFGQDYLERFRETRAARGQEAGTEARLQQGWFEWIEYMLKYGAVLLPSQRLDYGSHLYDPQAGGEGADIRLSGRIYFPLGANDAQAEREAVPLVVYCHGTELRRHAVPTYYEGGETALMALLATVSRCAVALPDYTGMGYDDAHYHPYCQRESLAYSVLDSIQGSLEKLEACKGVRWNGEVYIVGYSEGGYSALAAVKELHTNPRYEGLRSCVKGAAPMAGPFDLSATMRDVMVGQDKHPNPFFLSYVIYGYHAVYGAPFAPADTMDPLLTIRREGRNLDTYMNGAWSGSEANDFIRGRLGLAKDEPVLPLATLNTTWSAEQLTSASYPQTPTGQVLMANDLVRNRYHAAPWSPAPAFRTFYFHSLHDDNVAPANTAQAATSWPGARQFVCMPEEWCGQKLNHVQGAMVGIPLAFLWIKAGMPVQ